MQFQLVNNMTMVLLAYTPFTACEPDQNSPAGQGTVPSYPEDSTFNSLESRGGKSHSAEYHSQNPHNTTASLSVMCEYYGQGGGGSGDLNPYYSITLTAPGGAGIPDGVLPSADVKFPADPPNFPPITVTVSGVGSLKQVSIAPAAPSVFLRNIL
jgi:hypothetical protein